MEKTLNAFIEKIEGKMLAIATDETLDRHGESLPIDSWDLKNFKKNPVLLWSHDYYAPPVGIAKNIKVKDGKMTFEPVFHEITQAAKEVKKLFEEGIMNSFSVGFIPHNLKDGKMSLELLEISAVAVPANPSAIMIEKSMKSIGEDDKKNIVEWVQCEVKAEGDEAPAEDIAKDETEIVTTEKIGKVLSAKNRSVVEAAINALSELLNADAKEDPASEESKAKSEEADEEVEVFEDKDIKSNNKGRNQALVFTKALEAISKQTAFIARKVSKK